DRPPCAVTEKRRDRPVGRRPSRGHRLGFVLVGSPGSLQHDRDLAAAFDDQAPRFELSPISTDHETLDRLVQFANLLPDSLVVDASCGPSLVATAFLTASHRVRGYDLSAEMVARARTRNIAFGDRAVFE